MKQKGIYYNIANFHYFIYFEGIENNRKITVVVNKIETPVEGLNSGAAWELEHYELEEIFKLEIWPKYYFPAFTAKNYQWYHNDNDLGLPNYHIQAFANVMNFALRKGIEKANIETI